VETTTGKEIRQFKGKISKVLSCAISTDGKFVAAGGEDKTARIRDLQTGKQLHQINHAEKVYSIAFSPDSRHLLTSGEDFNAWLFSTKTGKPEMPFTGHGSRIYSVAYRPTGEQVLTGSSDGTVRLWSAKTGKRVKIFSEKDPVSSFIEF
jgi:WD40 repeat protein